MERNNIQHLIHVKRLVLDAWRQVLEVILNACHEDIISTEQRTTAIFELLQDLLKKVMKSDSLIFILTNIFFVKMLQTVRFYFCNYLKFISGPCSFC